MIQKIYNYLLNPGTKIEYSNSRYKKFIKDVVTGTLERSELIEDTINNHLNGEYDLTDLTDILNVNEMLTIINEKIKV